MNPILSNSEHQGITGPVTLQGLGSHSTIFKVFIEFIYTIASVLCFGFGCEAWDLAPGNPRDRNFTP